MKKNTLFLTVLSVISISFSLSAQEEGADRSLRGIPEDVSGKEVVTPRVEAPEILIEEVEQKDEAVAVVPAPETPAVEAETSTGPVVCDPGACEIKVDCEIEVDCDIACPTSCDFEVIHFVPHCESAPIFYETYDNGPAFYAPTHFGNSCGW